MARSRGGTLALSPRNHSPRMLNQNRRGTLAWIVCGVRSRPIILRTFLNTCRIRSDDCLGSTPSILGISVLVPFALWMLAIVRLVYRRSASNVAPEPREPFVGKMAKDQNPSRTSVNSELRERSKALSSAMTKSRSIVAGRLGRGVFKVAAEMVAVIVFPLPSRSSLLHSFIYTEREPFSRVSVIRQASRYVVRVGTLLNDPRIALRALASRDMTVPIGMDNISAISR